MPAMVLGMSFRDADQLIHQFKRSRLHSTSVAITRQLLLHLSSCAAAGNVMAGIGMKALLVLGSKVYEG